MTNLHVERERHANAVKKLNPPVFQYELRRDWRKDLYLHQVDYRKHRPDPVWELITGAAILAVVIVCWVYSKELQAFLQMGGVR
jgi:hypothetical protein